MTAPDTGAEPGQQTPPTCFRHPDRESWVSCVRCGRHACPDCLREASVGQQCVECVRGAAKGARRTRTAFGGRASASSATPLVTWSILGLNIALYLVQLAYPNLASDWAMFGYATTGGPGPVQGVAAGQPYRLLTAAFLPGPGLIGLMDIAFNMWALYVVGPGLEHLLGRVRYIALYVLSGIAGNVLYYLLAPPYVPALGASGAIFGLFAAWFVVARRLRLNIGGIATVIVANLIFSFLWARIAWQAHVGGLIIGAALAAAYAYAPRKYQAPVQAAATVAAIVLLAVAVVVRNGQLVS